MSPDARVWLDLSIVCVAALAGIGLARALTRFKIPKVTVYLLAGLLLGPHVFGIVDSGVVERSSAIPELLLAFVSFMLGERLTAQAIRLQGRKFPMIAALALLLPFIAVAVPTCYWMHIPRREAIVLGLFAMAGAPATVLAVGSALSASGSRHDLLATLAALDNVVLLLAYGVAAPFLVAPVTESWTAQAAIAEVGLTLVVGVVLGVLGGWILSTLTDRTGVEQIGSQITAALLVVLAVTATAHLLGSSCLIACAIAGIVVATTQEKRESDNSTFRALSGVEDIVYVLFFLFAGTELVPSALMAAGALAFVYIVCRASAKVLAGFAGGLLRRDPLRESWLLGIALLPQAGVVVGLALDAEARFPEVGSELLTVVMAALIVFELVGPLAVHKALACFKDRDMDGMRREELATATARRDA